jgi:hypothetical protein
MRLLPHPSRPAAVLLALAVCGCGGAASPGSAGIPAAATQTSHSAVPSSSQPILVTFDTTIGSLKYWPIQRGGSSQLQTLSAPLGIHDGYALAADGNTIVIANYQPAEVMTYDIKTKAVNTMSDPYGSPYDIAIGKDGTYYAMSLADVAVYKPGSSQPSELTCSYVNDAVGIAVDNEGDVFINGYGNNFIGVVEYPAGSGSCIKLHLRTELGYPADVAVDPRTDDLIVIDNPNFCAGGLEGRMIIYPRPYRQRNSVRRVLGATYCAGTVRLDARSEHIFEADATVSAGFPLIDGARYPSAKGVGVYKDGNYSGDQFAGFTTVPNTLPN